MDSSARIKVYLEYAAAARRRADEATTDIARQRHTALANSWEVLVAQEQDLLNWPHGPRRPSRRLGAR